MELVEDGHHECWALLVAADCRSVRIAKVVAFSVSYLHVSTRLCAQLDPVVQGAESRAVTLEHVFVHVAFVWIECVGFERDWHQEISQLWHLQWPTWTCVYSH